MVTTGTGQFRLAEVHSWIPQFGVSWALGVDGIALSLILMALILTPVSAHMLFDRSLVLDDSESIRIELIDVDGKEAYAQRLRDG